MGEPGIQGLAIALKPPGAVVENEHKRYYTDASADNERANARA